VPAVCHSQRSTTALAAAAAAAASTQRSSGGAATASRRDGVRRILRPAQPRPDQPRPDQAAGRSVGYVRPYLRREFRDFAQQIDACISSAAEQPKPHCLIRTQLHTARPLSAASTRAMPLLESLVLERSVMRNVICR
jgi:hypothetical protein